MVDQSRCNDNLTQSFTTAQKGGTILCDLIPGEVFSFFDMFWRIGILLQNQTVLSSVLTCVTSGLSPLLSSWNASGKFPFFSDVTVCNRIQLRRAHNDATLNCFYCENLRVLSCSHMITRCRIFQAPFRVVQAHSLVKNWKKHPLLACDALFTPQIVLVVV